jgi:hypothetical protein
MADFAGVRECGPSDDGTCLVLQVELQDGSLRHLPVGGIGGMLARSDTR